MEPPGYGLYRQPAAHVKKETVNRLCTPSSQKGIFRNQTGKTALANMTNICGDKMSDNSGGSGNAFLAFVIDGLAVPVIGPFVLRGISGGHVSSSGPSTMLTVNAGKH